MGISESDLPGIGRRYEILAGGGQSVVVVVHHSGRRDLYVMERNSDDPKCAVELSDDQARRVGGILGGSSFKPAVVEEIENLIGEFVVDWVTVGDDSPVVGRSIGELQIRRQTGMSVIAIVRGKSSINAPDPSEKIQAGDRLVVVGPRSNFPGFINFVLG